MFGSPFLHSLYSGRNVYSEILHTERTNKMKTRKEQKLFRQQNLLKGAGIESLYDLMNISVSDLILIIGSHEIDELLESLLTELVYGRYEGDFRNHLLSDYEGHQYVCDVFEANDFNENPEWFYEITVKDFLELDDLSPSNIPFLTDRIKNYVENGTMLIPERYSFCDDECYSYCYEMEAC